jgi:hypothetical protein
VVHSFLDKDGGASLFCHSNFHGHNTVSCSTSTLGLHARNTRSHTGTDDDGELATDGPNVYVFEKRDFSRLRESTRAQTDELFTVVRKFHD